MSLIVDTFQVDHAGIALPGGLRAFSFKHCSVFQQNQVCIFCFRNTRVRPLGPTLGNFMSDFVILPDI